MQKVFLSSPPAAITWPFQVVESHKRKRRIPAGTADHIGFTLIEIHHRIVGSDTYLPVVGKNAVTEMGKLLCRLLIISADRRPGSISAGHYQKPATPDPIIVMKKKQLNRCIGKHDTHLGIPGCNALTKPVSPGSLSNSRIGF